jgi:hypothetical protein
VPVPAARSELAVLAQRLAALAPGPRRCHHCRRHRPGLPITHPRHMGLHQRPCLPLHWSSAAAEGQRCAAGVSSCQNAAPCRQGGASRRGRRSPTEPKRVHGSGSCSTRHPSVHAAAWHERLHGAGGCLRAARRKSRVCGHNGGTGCPAALAVSDALLLALRTCPSGANTAAEGSLEADALLAPTHTTHRLLYRACAKKLVAFASCLQVRQKAQQITPRCSSSHTSSSCW